MEDGTVADYKNHPELWEKGNYMSLGKRQIPAHIKKQEIKLQRLIDEIGKTKNKIAQLQSLYKTSIDNNSKK